MTLIKTYFTEKFIQKLRISELLFNLYKRYLRFHDKIYRDFIIKFVSTIDCVVSVEIELSDCNRIPPHNHLVRKRTLKTWPVWLNGWVFF